MDGEERPGAQGADRGQPRESRPEEPHGVDAGELHDALLGITRAAANHFGDREPTDEELRAFLRARLIAAGKTPAEADAFLDEL